MLIHTSIGFEGIIPLGAAGVEGIGTGIILFTVWSDVLITFWIWGVCVYSLFRGEFCTSDGIKLNILSIENGHRSRNKTTDHKAKENILGTFLKNSRATMINTIT
jgi:hypothetical protein